MTKHTLKVETRKVTGRKVKHLRKQGLVPANVFGRDLKSEAVQLVLKDFQKIYAQVGESTLLYLQLAGQDRPVMIHDVVIHPVTGQVLHVTFHQVNLKEKITTAVKIHIAGVAPAVSEGKGILVQQIQELEIEALPSDMPEHIDVNVAALTDVDMAIMVKDIKLDAKLISKTDPETIVAKVEPLAKEEVVEVPVVAVPAEGTAPTEAAPTVEPETSEDKKE